MYPSVNNQAFPRWRRFAPRVLTIARFPSTGGLMAGVQIHDAINPKDDQSRTPMQCWRAQSDAHTAPCGLSLLPGTERQSLLPVAKHPAAAFQSSMGVAAGTHQQGHRRRGTVGGP